MSILESRRSRSGRAGLETWGPDVSGIPATVAELPFDALLHAAGLDDSHVEERLVVGAGRELALPGSAGLAPTLIRTDSFDTYKGWVGVPDSELDESTYPLRPELQPSGPWSGRSVRGAGDLTPAEAEDVQRAMRLYLFGPSAWASGYREVIERCYAPFTAAVFAVRSLVIEPGGALRVSGWPTLLLVEDFVLQAGGRLSLHTPCRVHVGRLARIGDAGIGRGAEVAS